MHTSNPGYKPGDYWMVCDLCGFDYRRSQMKQTWDGKWVCREDWEPKHPQLEVEGREDIQAVPVARPDTTDFTNETTLSVAASTGDSTITVADATGVSDHDAVGIMLDDDTVHWTNADGDPVGAVITLYTAMSGDAAIGNTVYTPGDSFGSCASADDL